ncbi:MAG: CRISPR-associated endonuclease Cas6, partial [bacterium]
IKEKSIILKTDYFGTTDKDISYSFLTPWLALNEKNYEEYQKLGAWQKRRLLLEKILVGNIISISKSLGYTIFEPIKANLIKIKEVTTKLKNIPMLAFLGTFSVNFEIPDYWGIGKSVSRGFGTIIKTDDRTQSREYRFEN